MNRSLVVFLVIAAAAIVVAATKLFSSTTEESINPVISPEKRAAREAFFGVPKERPSIPKGQEMQPRW